MKKYLLLTVTLLSFSTHAQLEQKSKGALSHSPLTAVFKADLKDGFHFNEKAPNKLTVDNKSFKPTQISARTLEFSQLPKMKKDAKASLFVCDDGLTTCEMHAIDLGKKKISPVAASSPRSPDFGKINEHGFIVDDLQSALNLGQKQERLILVDFSARWCPSCVRLEGEIFTLPEFKKLTENYVKVKIDTDRFENTVVAEKFKIVGIPTLLVINSNQQEIDRILDYQPMTQIRDFLAAIKEDSTPIAELMQKSSTAGEATLLTLGRRLLASGRTQDSVDLFSKLKSRPNEYWEAKIALAAENSQKSPLKTEDQIQVLREALAAEGESSRSINWRRDLVALLEKNPTEQKKLVAEGVTLADSLLSDRDKLMNAIKTERVGEFTDFEPLMIAMARADLIETGENGKDNQATTAAWLKAANAGTLLNIDADHEGTAVRYLIVLSKAKLWSEANSLALSLLAKNPKNVDIQRRRLKMLMELKKFDEAILVGNQVLKQSYGRNEFWVAESLAKSYLAAKKNKEARALVERYLSRNEIDWSNLESSKKKLLELKLLASDKNHKKSVSNGN